MVRLAGQLLQGTCAIGLLLVVATEQKMCTWAPPPSVEKPAAGDTASARAEAPRGAAGRSAPASPGRRPPLTLATALPDVISVRWDERGVRVVRCPRDQHTGDAGSGAASADARSTGDFHKLPAAPLRCEALRIPPQWAAAGGERILSGRAALLASSISPTGPPRRAPQARGS